MPGNLGGLPAPARRSRMRSLVDRRGFALVTDLAKVFEISEVTARADLDALAAEGSVRRVHGGADCRSEEASQRRQASGRAGGDREGPAADGGGLRSAERARRPRIGVRAARNVHSGLQDHTGRHASRDRGGADNDQVSDDCSGCSRCGTRRLVSFITAGERRGVAAIPVEPLSLAIVTCACVSSASFAYLTPSSTSASPPTRRVRVASMAP